MNDARNITVGEIETDEEKIAVGDSVRLKSGRTKMVVEAVQRPGDWADLHRKLFGQPLRFHEDDKTTICVIVERDGRIRRDFYDLDLLVKVKPEDEKD